MNFVMIYHCSVFLFFIFFISILVVILNQRDTLFGVDK